MCSAGAVGINLTQANRVFLMEPSINPALEVQAIGRVHRLGQTRPVEIVRLISEDTVESRMVTMLDKKYGNRESTGTEESAGAITGHLRTDRATVVKHEFDLLFGVLPSQAEADGDDENVPDVAVSGDDYYII